MHGCQGDWSGAFVDGCKVCVHRRLTGPKVCQQMWMVCGCQSVKVSKSWNISGKMELPYTCGDMSCRMLVHIFLKQSVLLHLYALHTSDYLQVLALAWVMIDMMYVFWSVSVVLVFTTCGCVWYLI